MPEENYKTFVAHILRYTSDLVRDEWLNIGILLFDPETGERSIRLIEEEREFARLRRMQPSADEDLIRRMRDHLEDHFETLSQQFRGGSSTAPQDFRKLIEKWDGTLSTGLQLSPQKGVHAVDLEQEASRLYSEHVELERGGSRVGAPGSRATMRNYCSQVWHQARLWERIEKSTRVAEFTFPGLNLPRLPMCRWTTPICGTASCAIPCATRASNPFQWKALPCGSPSSSRCCSKTVLSSKSSKSKVVSETFRSKCGPSRVPAQHSGNPRFGLSTKGKSPADLAGLVSFLTHDLKSTTQNRLP